MPKQYTSAVLSTLPQDILVGTVGSLNAKHFCPAIIATCETSLPRKCDICETSLPQCERDRLIGRWAWVPLPCHSSMMDAEVLSTADARNMGPESVASKTCRRYCEVKKMQNVSAPQVQHARHLCPASAPCETFLPRK